MPARSSENTPRNGQAMTALGLTRRTAPTPHAGLIAD